MVTYFRLSTPDRYGECQCDQQQELYRLVWEMVTGVLAIYKMISESISFIG